MNNRKIFWWVGAILTFSSFLFIIPLHIYKSAPVLLSIFGAALLIFFLVQALWDFKSFQDIDKPDSEETTTGRQYAPLMIIPGIIMIFIFYFNYSARFTKEIKKTGIISTATVIDGESNEGGKSNSYEITITFSTKSGKEISKKLSISSSEYKKIYKGSEISIIYAEKYPEDVIPIISEESVKEYIGIDSRSITLRDLYKVSDYKSIDSISKYLNSISFKWAFENDTTRVIWENHYKDEVVTKNILGITSYVSTDFNEHEMFMNDIKKDGFSKISKDSTGTEIYENNSFRLSIGRKSQEEDGRIGFLLYNVIHIMRIQ